MTRTALFVGASGLIGRQVLKDVLKNGDYDKIISIGRRTSNFDADIPQEKLVQITVDFEKIDDYIDEFRNINDVFFCLGTSPYIAGSVEQFLKVDRDYIRNTAKAIAKVNKPQGEELIPIHFLYCSAMKASKDASLDVIKIKGENEEFFSDLGFKRISVFRIPFVKVTEQREKPRMIESVFTVIFGTISWLFNLKIFVPSDVIGRAFSRVAADPSIRPLNPKDISESNLGSIKYIFSGADMLNMESKAKAK